MTYPESPQRWAYRITGDAQSTRPMQYVRERAAGVLRRLVLRALRLYTLWLIADAGYQERWHMAQAARAMSESDARYYASVAASHGFVAQGRRVDLARLEAALWPVRGVA